MNLKTLILLGIFCLDVCFSQTSIDYIYDSSLSVSEPYFDFASSDFAEIVMKQTAFVDKTMLLEKLMEMNDTFILITAPRRFGKTTNLDMLRKFLKLQVNPEGQTLTKVNYKTQPVRDSINYRLFINHTLKITKNKKIMDKYFGRHPVIHVDFRDYLIVRKFNNFYKSAKNIIAQTYYEHRYLSNSTKLTPLELTYCRTWCHVNKYKLFKRADVNMSLRILSNLLFKHFNKTQVIVLIDGYDAPLTGAMYWVKKDADLDKIVELANTLTTGLLVDNDQNVHRAFITGISYFGDMGLSKLKNLQVFRFLERHPLVPFYGLIESDLEYVFEKFGFDSTLTKSAYQWYDGYISADNTKIYNTWAILHFLLFKSADIYWVETGVIEKVEDILLIQSIREKFEALTQNKTIEVAIKEKFTLQDIKDLRKLSFETQMTNYHLHSKYRKRLGKEDEQKNFFDLDVFFSFLFDQGYLMVDYSTKVRSASNKTILKVPNDEVRSEFMKGLDSYHKKHYKQFL